jgi:3-deoxy-D-manno-octulosonate 8-phosphate phosphatase (KDO 8-P phosphatase)
MINFKNIKLVITDVDGVLSDGKVYYGESGEELKSFNIKDGLGIKLLASIGIQTAIITGRDSKIVARRAKELGIEHLYQGKKNKLESYNQILNSFDISPNQVAYLGDDLPDLPLLVKSGVGVAVNDAATQLIASADYVTRTKGGEGCLREVAELIIEQNGSWETLLKQFS